ncbi:MAG: GGDEF domain-containing protein [Burkholderiaceae bacterium]
MSAPHFPASERALDPALEAAWLNHPCSPIDAAAFAETYLKTHVGCAPHDLVFAHLIAASGGVRIADAARAHAHLAQARSVLSRSTARTPTFQRLLQIVHGVHAALHWVERDLVASMVSFERALGQPQALEPSDAHYIRLWRAITLLGLGKPELAFRDLLIGLEYFRVHYPPAHALMAFNVGATLLHAGDWEGAESCIRMALAESGRIGMPGFEIMCRSNLAYCLVNTGRVEEAKIEIDLALRQDRTELLLFRSGDVLTTVAENLIETGHLDEATDYVFDALDAAIGRGFTLGIGTAKWNQGRIAAAQGKIPEAVSAWRTALWNLRRHPHLTQFWKTALAVSTMYSQRGDYRRAFHWHQRFHASHRRWQDTTRDVRLAYSQAMLQMETIRRERDSAEAERLRLLQAKTELEAVNTELQTRFTEIEAIHDELLEQASRDPLTGLLNRRNLLPTLGAMLEKSAIGRQHVIVAMLDLDHFKQFNDRHGHVAGDQILAAAGHLLRDFFRDEDRAFRYGGDEFCIFLPKTNQMVGRTRLENFAQGLGEMLPRAPDGSPSGVAVSFGIACFPVHSMQAGELLAIADADLYTAKRRRKENTAHDE